MDQKNGHRNCPKNWPDRYGENDLMGNKRIEIDGNLEQKY